MVANTTNVARWREGERTLTARVENMEESAVEVTSKLDMLIEERRAPVDGYVGRSIARRINAIERSSEHFHRRIGLVEHRLETLARERTEFFSAIDNGLIDLRLRVQLAVCFAAFALVIAIVASGPR